MIDNELEAFENGRQAFEQGKLFAERLRIANLELRHLWVAGYRSVERWAKNPPMPVEEYLRVCVEAEAAYRVGVPQEANPYQRDTEAYAIWDTIYIDARNAAKGDDFEILGTPIAVTEFANHDGTFTYVVAAPQNY